MKCYKIMGTFWRHPRRFALHLLVVGGTYLHNKNNHLVFTMYMYNGLYMFLDEPLFSATVFVSLNVILGVNIISLNVQLSN